MSAKPFSGDPKMKRSSAHARHFDLTIRAVPASFRPMNLRKAWLGAWGVLFLVACGGAPQTETTLPNESLDLEGGSHFSSAGTTAVGPDVAGTQWHWLRAQCTEGPLDLAQKGFQQVLRVRPAADGFVLVYDQTFNGTPTASAAEPPPATACKQTIMQHVIVGAGREWQVREEARVTVPATPECEGTPEDSHPGEVRRRGSDLEVLVQRASACGGFELQMVYAPAAVTPLSEEELVRHYVAYINRKDVTGVVDLFSDVGSLVESFSITEDGNPLRHDGHEGVANWFAQAFGSVPWVAMKLTSVEPDAANAGHWKARWQYMDPRLENPIEGQNLFTMAAGEIYETQISVDAPAQAPGASGAASTPAAGPGDTSATPTTRRGRRTH